MDTLSSQIYAIQLPPHLLAQPSAPAPFLPEDIHICGNCKQSFTDIRYFLHHKNECNAFLSSATAAFLETTSASVNLQMLGSDQPLLQVMINEENQSVLVQTQENDNSGLNSADNNTNGTTNVLAAATTLLECGNINVSTARRDIQIDEEDVASLLANQFAKEAVFIPPDSPLHDKPGTVDKNEIFVQVKDANEKLLSANYDNIATHLQESSVETVENVMKDNEVIENASNNSCTANDGKVIDYDKGNKKGVQPITVTVQANSPSETPQELSVLRAKRLTCCNLCSFVTMYPSDLTRHMRKHTGERPFQCNVCSQRFPRRDKLQTHLRIHTGEKPYRCQFCDYAAIDSGPLRKHLRTHTDERPFKCQFCPYSAKDTSQLTVHLRTHTGDAPFICQFEKCGRAFKTSTDLKRHGVVHKRVHPFACKLCDYKASNKLNLQAHYQLSHNAVVIDDNIFKCVASGCDFETSNVNDFQKHQQDLHPVPDILNLDDADPDDSSSKKKKYNSRVSANNRCHACSFCNHEAQNQSSLKRHVRKQHSNGNSNSSSGGGKLQSRLVCQKAHHCTYCLASFVRQDSLRSHLKQHLNNNVDTLKTINPSKDINKQQIETGSSSELNKQQIETVSSSELITNSTCFIENILEGDCIQITN